MADRLPIKAKFAVGSPTDVIALQEFEPTDTIPVNLISGFPSAVTIELGNNSISSLSDVNTLGSPLPSNGNVLAWNNTSGMWEPLTLPSSGINLQDTGTNIPNTPHDTLNFVGMDLTDNNDGSANIANVFGSYFFKGESLGVTTTTSTIGIIKVSLTTTTLPIGTYRIGVSYGWNHNSTTSDFEARLFEDAIQKGEIHKQEPKDAAGAFSSTGTSQRYYNYRVFYSSYISAATHTFYLEFRTDNVNDSSSIWDAVIEIYRVS